RLVAVRDVVRARHARPGEAVVAEAVAVAHAVPLIRAQHPERVARRTAAIDVGLGAVLLAIHARDARARAAIVVGAIRARRARLAVEARLAHRGARPA